MKVATSHHIFFFCIVCILVVVVSYVSIKLLMKKKSIGSSLPGYRSGINMKCKLCDQEGVHYHYDNNSNNNNNNLPTITKKNHGSTKKMCMMCMKEKGQLHYHKESDIVSK